MKIAQYIDHTLLKPDATPEQITTLCMEALQYGFASVCVNSSYVPQVKKLLAGSVVAVCAVIGFPLGAMSSGAKIAEGKIALSDGADELDMVINVGRLKSGDVEYVRNEINALARTVHAEGAILKVIIETALLTDDEKRLACTLAQEAVADGVKTCSGFASGPGATVADIRLMRAVVGPTMIVKASKDVSTYEVAKALIDAGATRIGSSKSIAIVTGAPASTNGGY